MYELLIAVFALIISVLSALFVVLKEGVGMALGFRESETTSTKRKEITNVLSETLKKDVVSFLEKNRSKKDTDDEMMDAIVELAGKQYYKNLGNELLQNTTLYFVRYLRTLATTLVTVFLTIVYLVVYHGIYPENLYYFLGLFFIVLTIIVARQPYTNARKYYCVREAFLRLSEQPTFENCASIEGYLEEKGIPI